MEEQSNQEERKVAKFRFRQKSSSDASLTPPPEKKARIDAAENKIAKISDLPDLESGLKIWRKALEDAKSYETGYESKILFLEQKIEELESKVDKSKILLLEEKIEELESKVDESKIVIKELESKVNIILGKLISCKQIIAKIN